MIRSSSASSRDSVKSHEKFKAVQSFPFELLSDEQEQLCKLFDVIREKNMYGRKVMGVERSTFLLDPKGCLAARMAQGQGKRTRCRGAGGGPVALTGAGGRC